MNESGSGPSGLPGAILLVEDDPDDAYLTMRAWTHRNPMDQVAWVRSGEEALCFLFAQGTYRDRDKTQVPQLVVLDLNLPDLDGLQVLVRMRADELLRAVPVVMLTGSTQTVDISEAYGAGVNSFISKPVRFEEFQAAVEQVASYWTAMNHVPPTGHPRHLKAMPAKG